MVLRHVHEHKVVTLIKRPSYVISILACVGVFFLLFLRSVVYQYTHIHGISFADDAFYYVVVAQHIVHDGVSTFDGTTLTNGYHPLWMALLTVQFKVLGQSLLLTRAIEFFLAEAALVFALLLIRLPNLLLNILFTAGFFAIMQRISFNGMETALLTFCFCLFTYISERHSHETSSGGIVDGLLAAAAVGSRIDAIVFVLPQAMLTARSWSRRATSLAVLLLCGGIYAAANHYYFGLPVPISGEVKSLGGMQVNWALLRFLGDLSQPPTRVLYAAGLLFVVALFLARRPRPYVNRHIVIAFLLGYLIYLARLAFVSSWVIWPWYGYPVLIGYIACVPYLLVTLKNTVANREVSRQLIPAAALGLFVLLLFGGPRDAGGPRPKTTEGLPVTAIDPTLAVERLTDGARVAMGDRAGSFAYHYPGSVNQLEGIVNDEEYLRALRNKGDVKTLLCERKVKFLVAYEPDLSNYKVHLVRTIRPELSQYPAPEIPVLRADQVLQMPDLSIDRPAKGSTYLYVWRLSCGTPGIAGSE